MSRSGPTRFSHQGLEDRVIEPSRAAGAALERHWRDYIHLMRPRQWVKNALCLAPLLFARRVGMGASVLEAGLVALAFTLLASGTYAVNDAADYRADRLHAGKRLRPVAAGAIHPARARAFGLLLMAAGLGAAATVNLAVLGIAGAYVASNLAYNAGLKRVPLLDALLVSLGFVLRAAAGALGIGVALSQWLGICTLLLSLLLTFAKRRQELNVLAADAARHRSALGGYTVAFLDQMLAALLGATLVSYALYTVASGSGIFMDLSLVLVVFGLSRYLYLVSVAGAGGAPEEALLTDKPLFISVAAWVACCALALYVPLGLV